MNQQAWQVKLSHSLGMALVGPHESSIPGAKQKLGIYERAQKCVACAPIQPPQPLRLRDGEAESRHLDEFALHASKYVVKRLLLAAAGGALAWWAASTLDSRSYRRGQLRAVLPYGQPNWGDPVTEASEESFPASDSPSH